MTTNDDRVERRSYPTVAFTIFKSQRDWIARRAKELGVSKSEFVRRTIAKAMDEEQEAAA